MENSRRRPHIYFRFFILLHLCAVVFFTQSFFKSKSFRYISIASCKFLNRGHIFFLPQNEWSLKRKTTCTVKCNKRINEKFMSFVSNLFQTNFNSPTHICSAINFFCTPLTVVEKKTKKNDSKNDSTSDCQNGLKVNENKREKKELSLQSNRIEFHMRCVSQFSIAFNIICRSLRI